MATALPRPFAQVDVFTSRALLGNPVAVVLDGSGVDDPTMQSFTDWTNLSEATFVLPPSDPTADYRLRIFCPGRELPFAGHPTLGSCHAWLETGAIPKNGDVIVQECGAGLVRIRRAGQVLSFAAPALRKSGLLDEADVEQLVAGLGIKRTDVKGHQWCDNGPGWRSLLLEDGELVRNLQPDPSILDGLDVGVVGPGGAGGTDFEVRAFFPGNSGLTEDPVTGSLNAALAQWLIPAGIAPANYVASQGTMLGRAGRVHVESDGTDIWVGGESTTVMRGTVAL